MSMEIKEQSNDKTPVRKVQSTPSNTLGTSLTGVAKSSAGNLMAVYATNDNAAVRYLQIHNKATAPSTGNSATYCFPIPGGTANNPGQLALDEAFFGKYGVNFSTGISWGFSNTKSTFNAVGTASDHTVHLHVN